MAQVIRAAFLRLSDAVPELRESVLQALVAAHVARSRFVKWRSLSPEVSKIAGSKLRGLLQPVKDPDTGETNFHVVHKRFLEWAVARSLCGKQFALAAGEDGVADLLAQMDPDLCMIYSSFGSLKQFEVRDLRQSGLTAQSLAREGFALG